MHENLTPRRRVRPSPLRDKDNIQGLARCPRQQAEKSVSEVLNN
jgi:hypothetical protein